METKNELQTQEIEKLKEQYQPHTVEPTESKEIITTKYFEAMTDCV